MASTELNKYRSMSLERISAVLAPLVSSNFTSLWRLTPSLVKYVLWALILVNIRSFPLAWHCEFFSFTTFPTKTKFRAVRVFRPVFRLRLQYRLLRLKTFYKPRAVQIQAEDQWLDSISPVGAHPFNFATTYRSWASMSTFVS